MKEGKNWLLFLAGSFVTLALAMVVGIIIPISLIPVMILWSFLPFTIGGILIVLIYYFFVVFGFSWLYEQYTAFKPDYWVSSFYLLLIAAFFQCILYVHFYSNNNNPFDYFNGTKGVIIICCLIPAWIRILGVTLIGAFYTKIK